MNGKVVLEKEVLPIILNHLKGHSGSSKIHLEILSTLVNFCFHSDLGRVVAKASGAQIVLSSMHRFKEFPEIQVCGFHVLSYLGKHDRVSEDVNSFIEIILGSLRRFKLDKKVCGAALNAIGSFIFADKDFESVKFELVSLIMEALDRFQDSLCFGVTTCFALARLSIMQSKRLVSLSRLIYLFLIIIDLIWFVFVLALDEPLLSPGEITLILKGMQRFRNFESYQTTALCALASLIMSQGIATTVYFFLHFSAL